MIRNKTKCINSISRNNYDKNVSQNYLKHFEFLKNLKTYNYSFDIRNAGPIKLFPAENATFIESVLVISNWIFLFHSEKKSNPRVIAITVSDKKN